LISPCLLVSLSALLRFTRSYRTRLDWWLVRIWTRGQACCLERAGGTVHAAGGRSTATLAKQRTAQRERASVCSRSRFRVLHRLVQSRGKTILRPSLFTFERRCCRLRIGVPGIAEGIGVGWFISVSIGARAWQGLATS